MTLMALNCPVIGGYNETFTRTWSKVTDDGENVILFSALNTETPGYENARDFYERFPGSERFVRFGIELSSVNLTSHSLLFNASLVGNREVLGLSQVFGTWNCTVSNRNGRDSVLTTILLTNDSE